MNKLQLLISKIEAKHFALEGDEIMFERISDSGSLRMARHARQNVEDILDYARLLLNTENENGGKNDASNGGKPM